MITRIIRVAAHGRYRRDLLQLQEDCVLADVAGMEDVVHAGEEIRDSWVEEVMGIGDDADAHGNDA